MDLNHTLLWTVYISCGFSIIHLLDNRFPGRRNWLLATAGIPWLTWMIESAYPGLGGLIGGALWAGFLILPAICLRQANAHLLAFRFAPAARYQFFTRLLHPSALMREQYALLANLALAARGEWQRAEPHLVEMARGGNHFAMLARLFCYRFRGDWHQAGRLLAPQLAALQKTKNPLIIHLVLQMLGETSAQSTLVRFFSQVEPTLVKQRLYGLRTLLRAMVLAYCGRVDQVQRFLDGPLSHLPESQKQFLLATAEWENGVTAKARKRLAVVERDPDPSYFQALSKRVQNEPVKGVKSGAIWQYWLDRLDDNLQWLAVDPWGHESKNPAPVGTYCLIAANLIFFAVATWRGGSTNQLVLLNLGANLPQAVFDGEVWRLLAANFLHFGWLHLALNMAFLFYLGGFLEPLLGYRRFLAAYLFCGVGSMSLVSGYYYITGLSIITVGASGAVLGLAGIFLVYRFVAWLKLRHILAKQQLYTISLLLGVQVVYDLFTPVSSSLGHLSGAFLGVVAANVLLLLDHWRGDSKVIPPIVPPLPNPTFAETGDIRSSMML